MDANASSIIHAPQQPTVQKRRRITLKKNTEVSTTAKGWTLKPITDAPSVSWSDFDSGYQYTVQNPANQGGTLLKIQVYEHGVQKHISGVYLDPKADTVIYSSMNDLVTRLESMWAHLRTGKDGIVRTVTPLAAWRIPNRNIPNIKRKRKATPKSNLKQQNK